MGRPPRHDVDGLLDAAATLVADAGPRAVTVAAVARAAGAPSGSVYHRFPGRPALLAALWLRSLERFQAGFLVAVEQDTPLTAARSAARHIVAWSRANPADATILLYAADDFDAPEWPEEDRERHRRGNRRVARAVGEIGRGLGRTSDRDKELLRMAIVDLPYSVVRRYYRSGQRIPRHAEDLAAECAATLLQASS
ncbi:DNA-binding transcriptional regulator, AcrR family [Actinopolymorpha cephalotaxi]|uniref:AcrR family transcriptional regulator n=1 Tax=Actinopolymorpha cephalotaxi TaxID=504797 RepID=A0A1I2KIL8_9ACTN|nr:TetR family transcriptional regulator [Actinopolymorpha cephalotaxi]NYH84442.1 AcrR family transcriptional regulator [Actinopolymorpha cephalotaxi]SFF66178.1 DNA-binding transcriptional regulator, AcrR family [Actinopolymorpha cephalotaxi]